MIKKIARKPSGDFFNSTGKHSHLKSNSIDNFGITEALTGVTR